MLRNWITVCLRNSARHRLYAAINILGLAVGLAAALVIGVFVRHELSFDAFHPNADRIHKVYQVQYIPGRHPDISPVLSLPWGPLLREVPEVEAAVQFTAARDVVQVKGESAYQWFTMTGPDFFRLFAVEVLAGDPVAALSEPYGVVLSRSEARKLFGTEDAVGRTLELGSGGVAKVGAVVGDPPRNTEVLSNAYISLSTPLPWAARLREDWGQNSFETYVLTRAGADPAALRDVIQATASRVYPDYRPPGTGAFSFQVETVPLRQVHLRPDVTWQATSPDVLTAFTGLGVVLLLVASINFVNLSTARATLRAREVALRKTLGAGRMSLVAQFLGESVLLTLAAGVVAIALVELALPAFMDALGVRLDEGHTGLGRLTAIGVPLALAVGVAGGLYPALFLSRFRPAETLRGGGAAVGAGRLRALLVVLQFAVAIALAVSTWVILDQTRFAQTARIGFDRENVVLVRGVGHDTEARWQGLRDRLKQEPGVVSAAGAAWIPTDPSQSTSNYVVLDGPRAGEELTFRTERSDFDYLKTIGVRLLAGRLFDAAREADRVVADAGGDAPQGRAGASMVVSMSLVEQVGWGTAEQALGRTMTLGRGDGSVVLTVIGVVEDVQFSSVRQPKVPTVFVAYPEDASLLVVRVAGGALPAVLDRIDALWRETYPRRPVNRQFLDDQIELLYATERRQAKVLGVFAGLAIIVACLGLFGLAAFQAERRTKEIGVRKILGASVPAIVRLLVWQFSRPVLMANLIAWPVAWFLMDRWLSGYALRIDLGPMPFLAAGAGAVLIAWITVAGQAAGVARRKPVAALRYE